MASAIPDRAHILATLETLVIGAAGGLLFLWAGLPGGLISGAMFAVGGAALAGRPLALPPILTQTVLLLLGISLGTLVSRQLIQHMSSYPLTIGLLALVHLLLDLRQQLLSAARARLGPDLGAFWPAAPARCRKSSSSPPRRAPMSLASRWFRPCA